MKNYLIVFILFLFQYVFAPNLSEEQKRLVKKQNIEIENYRNSQIILENEDRKDLITLKSFGMNKRFNKEERMKVREICKKHRIPESKWLYKIIKIESSGNPKAVNKRSKATGLIGFLPSTANYLGTDTSELKKMSVFQQLEYVDKYLTIIMSEYTIKNFTDLYLAIFRPSAIGKSNNHILGHKNGIIFDQNRSLDMDKDSIITIKDIKKFISLI